MIDRGGAQGTSGPVLLARIALTGTGDIDFQSIPSGYAALILELSLRGSTADVDTGFYLRLNNDSGANYYGNAVKMANATQTIYNTAAGTQARQGDMPAATATANRFGAARVTLLDYANTSRHKTGFSQSGYARDNTAGQQVTQHAAFTWASTAAVTRVTILPGAGQWASGSSARLYGQLP